MVGSQVLNLHGRKVRESPSDHRGHGGTAWAKPLPDFSWAALFSILAQPERRALSAAVVLFHLLLPTPLPSRLHFKRVCVESGTRNVSYGSCMRPGACGGCLLLSCYF